MNVDFQSHIPTGFNDNSRVWIYQSSRPFLASEAPQVEDMMNAFVTGWNSHGAPVKGYAGLIFGQFILIMADETATGISGCSTDSSVRLIKSIEEKFNVRMFDRQHLAFVMKDTIQLMPLNQLGYAVENNLINADTLYFNNTVLTKKEMLDKWLIPVKESWLAKRVAFV